MLFSGCIFPSRKSIFHYIFLHITIIVISIVISCIILLLTGVQFLLSSSSLLREPQLTVLESGFERLKSRVLLSSSFFMMVALFVLFDLELILLFPAILYHSYLSLDWMRIWIFVVILVLITLFIEWVWFGLKWQV